ncbi:MAG TPA: hypothetical protein VHZ03_15825 [Trebonia sp.]|jgi:hypothetical protein|nr:hypothetical protein [Trebonia sp.]
MTDLRKALEGLLNEHSAENASDTPDFILAAYVTDSLRAFEKASRAREDWYGHRHAPGGEVTPGLNSQTEL